MNAIKSVNKKAPNTIPVPVEFQEKNIEVILLPIEEEKSTSDINVFFGALPDFPTRASQGELQERESSE